MSTKLTRDILQRFAEAGHPIPGDPDSWKIQRTYAGYFQRSEGAWSWYLVWKPRYPERPTLNHYGSQWTATQCSKIGATAYEDIHFGIELWPAEEHQ